ncbi:hypothetical protein GCM10010528_25430 [Gordonia defluvii]|uniref:Uncharacterized protein n=1 Tax=Gordonia defluvii TaxID=283718 RepID=A0ABP6LM10_9ACTN
MTTSTLTDPWVERLIRAGLIPERARGLDRADVAHRYNKVHDFHPADPDYLYSPGQAQETARDALALVGVDLPDGARIFLTDMTAGPRCWSYLANCGQIETACEEHRLTTGEQISADALIGALPWE